MNYRYFLQIPRTGLKKQIEEPEGFDAFSVKLARDFETHAFSIEHSIKRLGFYGEAYNIIKAEYDACDYADAQIIVTSEIQYDGSSEWVQEFSGHLNFDNYEDKQGRYNVIYAQVIQLGIQQSFINNATTKINLDSTKTIGGADVRSYANLGKQMTIPCKSIKLTTTGEQPTTKTTTFDNPGNGVKKFSISFEKDDLTELGKINTGEPKLFDDADYLIQIDDKQETLKHYGLRPLSVFLDMQINVNAVNQEYNASVSSAKLWIKKNNETSVFPISLEPMYGDSNYSLTVKTAEKYKTDPLIISNVGLNDKIQLYLEVSFHSNSNRNDKIIMTTYNNSKIRFEWESITNDTGASVYMLHEALNKTAEIISDNNVRVKSNFYGRRDSEVFPTTKNGENALRCITNGYKIRNAKMTDGTEPGFWVDFKGLLKALQAIDNVGFGFEEDSDGNVIARIEHYSYFYNDEVLLEINQANKQSRFVDADRVIGAFTVGYKKWESEQYNGLDSFLTQRTYRCSDSKVKIEMISDFIADPYAIESIRRLNGNKSSKDSKYDNDTVIFALKKNGANYEVDRGATETDGTIVYGEKWYNMALSPARMALKWFSWAMQCRRVLANYIPAHWTSQPPFQLIPAYWEYVPMAFSSGTGNYNAKCNYQNNVLTTGSVAENQNIDQSMLKDSSMANPVLVPELIEIPEYPLTLEEYLRIKKNPYGTVKVDGEICRIKEIEYKSKGVSSFILVPKR